MAQHSPGGVSTRPYGLGRNFGRTAKGLLFVGALLLALGLFAETAAASNEPKLTDQQASFTIPANNPTTLKWTLNLDRIGPGGHQALVGTDSATSGKLVVAVPKTKTCHFQLDVYRGVHFFAGFQQQLNACGQVTTSTTLKTTTTTQKTTTTTSKTTTTTSKPKTSGNSGSSTTVATKSGSSPTTAAAVSQAASSTTVSPSSLAFTGVGVGMWVIAAIGALLMLTGGALVLYVRRYPKTS
jgi:hypothetical protein